TARFSDIEGTCSKLGALPSPLWGGVGGGGRGIWPPRCKPRHDPPSPTLPHKGGGSRQSLRRLLSTRHRNTVRTRSAFTTRCFQVRCPDIMFCALAGRSDRARNAGAQFSCRRLQRAESIHSPPADDGGGRAQIS